jgi:DNA mismatch endonuclease (patch repair protein)
MTAKPISPEKRSVIMRAIRSKNTKPERYIRKLLHSLGYRFRVHDKGLPGSPDIVFSARKKVVFVHGCFWHQHPNLACQSSRRPKSNTEYWDKKLNRNIQRDMENQEDLSILGWQYLILWECELNDLHSLQDRLVSFLGPTKHVI